MYPAQNLSAHKWTHSFPLKVKSRGGKPAPIRVMWENRAQLRKTHSRANFPKSSQPVTATFDNYIKNLIEKSKFCSYFPDNLDDQSPIQKSRFSWIEFHQWCRHCGWIDHLGRARAGCLSSSKNLHALRYVRHHHSPLHCSALQQAAAGNNAQCCRELGWGSNAQCNWMQCRAESNWCKKAPRALVRPGNDWVAWGRKTNLDPSIQNSCHICTSTLTLTLTSKHQVMFRLLCTGWFFKCPLPP